MKHELQERSSARSVPAGATPGKQPSRAPARRVATLLLAPVAHRWGRRHVRPVPWQWLQDNTFAPTWLPVRLRQFAAGYVSAGLVSVLAVWLTHLLAAVFPLFAGCRALVFLGVVLVALNWGAVPSLMSAVVGVVLFEYAVLPPAFSWKSISMGGGVALVLLMGVGLAISVLAGSAERSRRRAMDERVAAQVRERATHQLQERMDEFLATASHDVRSPLTATIGFSSLAARRYERLASAVLDTRPDLADQVGRVQASLNDAILSVERLGRLVALLFDTARVRAGKLEVHRVPCDLKAVVHDHAAALRMANPQRALHLEVPVEGPVPVVADADRIGQVLTNYVSNAMKFSPGDQPVEIRMAIDGACAAVSVRDHGPGLPARERERIWQRFYQAEGVHAQHKSGAGLGLGLHICKAIVEGHGGEVGVESAVGNGSTFWFTLPLAPHTLASVPGQPSPGGDVAT